jgi:hypothetical protein
MYERHFECSVHVNASPLQVFDELDDQERLSAHMMKSSAMMAGSTMRFEFDERRGRSVGSRMRLYGNVLGFSLEVVEVVTERAPPSRKVWKTAGLPRLLVIGPYRMGFGIEPETSGSQLTLFIDYDLPGGAWRIAGKFLGGAYARWCTRNMTQGVTDRFAKTGRAA